MNDYIQKTDKNRVEAYRKASSELISEIKTALELYLNFETTINNELINFEMGGCGYNIYLSRGYICLEEEDNSTIENIYTVESVSKLIELIKDLQEDN